MTNFKLTLVDIAAMNSWCYAEEVQADGDYPEAAPLASDLVHNCNRKLPGILAIFHAFIRVSMGV